LDSIVLQYQVSKYDWSLFHLFSFWLVITKEWNRFLLYIYLEMYGIEFLNRNSKEYFYHYSIFQSQSQSEYDLNPISSSKTLNILNYYWFLDYLHLLIPMNLLLIIILIILNIFYFYLHYLKSHHNSLVWKQPFLIILLIVVFLRFLF